jgi:protein phosphatase 1 regulatory subunit 7
MSAAPLQPTAFDLPDGLDAPNTSTSSAPLASSATATDTADAPVTPPSEEESHEAFANLRDERTYEDLKSQRKAQLVMGPPLGENPNETVVQGEVLVENEEILAELGDETEDLDLTHLRLRTLRGLGMERFRVVQVRRRPRRWRTTLRSTDDELDPQRISLRQNLLSSLSYVPLPPVDPTPDAGHSLVAVTPTPAPDEVDEDSHDDEDAKKKEEDFEYHHHQKREDTVWPLRGMAELEELDLYDNRIKSIKGLEGLVSLT